MPQSIILTQLAQ